MAEKCDSSSHQKCSVKKVFLKISQNTKEKHLCQSLFFDKVTGLRPVTFYRTPPVVPSGVKY